MATSGTHPPCLAPSRKAAYEQIGGYDAALEVLDNQNLATAPQLDFADSSVDVIKAHELLQRLPDRAAYNQNSFWYLTQKSLASPCPP